MPLKTEAECLVTSDDFATMNYGVRREHKAGDTVFLPADVAKEMEHQGAVQIVTPADNS